MKKTRTPSLPLLLTEGVRTLSDFLEFAIVKNKLLIKANVGDGRPVVVIPGFMSDDNCSVHLREFLNNIGYESVGWELGANKGFDDNTYHKLINRLEKHYDEHKRPLTIIGWSLGGAYARVAANTRPDIISEIITIAGPISGNIYEANNVRYLFKLAHSGKNLGDRSVDKEVLSYILPTPPIKNTAIYSKFDGVIHWTHCMDLSGEPQVKNIEVKGSHSGLLLNAQVYKAIESTLSSRDRRVTPVIAEKFEHFWLKSKT
jgi:pimeloyl-ACP methyl ester carboxylesterase